MLATSLTQQLIEQAKELKFDLVGIVLPTDAQTYKHFSQWLELGYAGEMEYMVRTKQLRKNPKAIMKECKSVIVVGVSYANAFNDEARYDNNSDELVGWVSAYACRSDYHDVIRARLTELREWIKGKVSWAKCKVCVDSSPILERELAVRAGFGWFGKNTNVVSKQFGSYFFIGELLTNVELEPTEAFERDRCGICNRCIEACPTGALISPKLLDARRCISYLTIEHRSAIQFELRERIGRWIFGCDICQQVCPWNNKAKVGATVEQWKTRYEMFRQNLLELLSLSEDNFKRRFSGTPIARIGRKRFLRNVVVALGNTMDERAIEPLARLLCSNEDSLVRSHAAWALGRIGNRMARTALERFWKQECDECVRSEIENALQRMQ
ncbi:MAG: tRNA epoxyqueuosine(34) reductase QueG [Armatimonadota bacterium]|nr:tRNA epoxyqueuosine(34) reductase QueG [Armatimonadota bacterium]MDW8026602.1 tRNA epoxyqueuosine(34) reductase QueG [Armatimonadota bacterium]